MARFKAGDKVVLSKLMYEECTGLECFERAKQMMRDDGFLVVSEVFEPRVYIMEGLPVILFTEEWLEPYIEGTPAPLLSGPLYRPPEDKMTLRDQFAMAALTGLAVGNIDLKTETIVMKAYKIADAMMERRKG